MSTATVVRREVRCAQKVTLRDPQAAFFTVGLPLLYLFIFATVFGNQTAQLRGQLGAMKGSTMMVASVIVIGVVSAAFQNLATSLVQDREDGVLKRLRSTPVPTGAFLAGPVLNGMTTALLLTVLVTVLGRVAYQVSLPAGHLLAAVVTVLAGALACCALGCLFTVAIRKATAAMPMVTRGHAHSVLPVRQLLQHRPGPGRPAHRGRRVPGPALLRGDAHRVQPARERWRIRDTRPRDPRDLGGRRGHPGDAPLPLDASRRELRARDERSRSARRGDGRPAGVPSRPASALLAQGTAQGLVRAPGGVDGANVAGRTRVRRAYSWCQALRSPKPRRVSSGGRSG